VNSEYTPGGKDVVEVAGSSVVAGGVEVASEGTAGAPGTAGSAGATGTAGATGSKIGTFGFATGASIAGLTFAS
jgi:hypothetical protein